MGQPITVVEKPSATPGIVRYEINRNLAGMGHSSYRSSADATGGTPADELARRLFERGGIASVHIYNNVITVHLADGSSPVGISDLIEGLYIHYLPGVEVVIPPGSDDPA